MRARDPEIAERLLLDLVSTPSVSASERAAVDVFIDRAHGLGLDAEIDGAGNGIAERGPRDASIHVVLLGHIDTVPGAIPVRVSDGVLHGRGSVDAKGPLAAMLVAAARAELPDNVRVSVAAAVGEETPDSPGAHYLAERWRPDSCVIGEPSGWDGVTLGYKGRLLVEARTERACAHSAGAHASACDAVLPWWSDATEAVGRFNNGRRSAFERLQMSVRGLHSGRDGLRENATLKTGFRLPPGLEPETLGETLRQLAPPGITLGFSGQTRAHVSGRNDAVGRALSGSIRACGGRPRPKHKTGTSDMNVVGPAWGCPIAAYGPGDSALDHTPDERLSLDEYRRSIDVLTGALGSIALELCERQCHTARA